MSNHQHSPAHGPPNVAKEKDQEEDQEEEVYVLTLKTDPAHQTRMDSLRKAYFPPSRLKVGAHLTLFHALPQSRLSSAVKPVLSQVATDTAPFRITAGQLTLTRNSKAIMAYLCDDDGDGGSGGGAGQVTRLRERLRKRWLQDGFLSEQDQQRSGRPHYTIMNKVPDRTEVARAFEEAKAGWKPDAGVVVGMALWAYNGGSWRPVEEFMFNRE